jgi:hypothetical protein
MKKTVYIKMLIVFFLSQMNVTYAEVEAPRNPDSAKECAICHYRWIDTFFIDGKGTELVEYESEKVVAKPEICFSCHDGSVVPSLRSAFRVMTAVSLILEHGSIMT